MNLTQILFLSTTPTYPLLSHQPYPHHHLPKSLLLYLHLPIHHLFSIHTPADPNLMFPLPYILTLLTAATPSSLMVCLTSPHHQPLLFPIPLHHYQTPHIPPLCPHPTPLCFAVLAAIYCSLGQTP